MNNNYERFKIKNIKLFIIIFVVYCLITIIFLFWNMGWQMTLLDDRNPYNDYAPLGLKIVNFIALLLSFPLILIKDIHSILFDKNIVVFILIIMTNSFIVCYPLFLIWEKFIKKDNNKTL